MMAATKRWLLGSMSRHLLTRRRCDDFERRRSRSRWRLRADEARSRSRCRQGEEAPVVGSDVGVVMNGSGGDELWRCSGDVRWCSRW
ncbi:hypothetical protein M6B38_371045 [Iris pallida]|uniref:Uncharacterized protein n=1 Tax=Iris pallida TaxID=29817 RepID=A0AAX6GEE1_IRIPA|nr:hypothetical protein M6B38_371045 [Iris pallida]